MWQTDWAPESDHNTEPINPHAVTAPYVKTSRNSVLLKTCLDVGFVLKEVQAKAFMLELDCNTAPPASEIVSIMCHSIDVRWRSMSSIVS